MSTAMTWVDNVTRKAEFLTRHPDITITPPDWDGGRQVWAASGGILEEPVTHPELGGLLDKLGFIYGGG